ncbi:MAG: crossover junction endodeoxyribonuclease RuvC [Armatimonadota bacterium]|nr:crossover junction endodeoxyribonuclease RuvC [Armatimonadota bacterium]
MLVLGVDPGLRQTGYALLRGRADGVELVDTGLIRTDEDAPLPRRLQVIYRGMQEVLGRHRPVQVAVEDLYTARCSPRTAILMGHVRGVVCLAAAERAIEVVALPPAAVKQAIAGFGGASKAQVQAAVGRLLRRPAPADSHVADAVAVSLTALSRCGVPLRPAAAGVVR